MTYKKDKCLCPYCGFVVVYDKPFCQCCKIEFTVCEKCGGAMRKEAKVCPHCGARKDKKDE
jgi:predicted amidophosphoribosyltransferase